MKFFFPVILLIAVFASAPDVLAVDPNGLVTCDGSPLTGVGCDFCKFAEMMHKVGTYLVVLLITLATIMLAITGLQMAASGGDTGAKEKLKERMTNIVIGFILILASWVIVDTLMKALVSDASLREMWATPIGELCAPLKKPSGDTTAGTGVTTGTQGGGTAGCPDCVPIDSSVATCKNAASCTVDASFAENLGELSGYGIRVTEGYPPTYTHQNQCHQNGTCLDITITDWSYDNIAQFQADAAAAGYRAVYEPPRGESCPSGITCMDYSVTGATGRHFSLYAN